MRPWRLVGVVGVAALFIPAFSPGAPPVSKLSPAERGENGQDEKIDCLGTPLPQRAQNQTEHRPPLPILTNRART